MQMYGRRFGYLSGTVVASLVAARISATKSEPRERARVSGLSASAFIADLRACAAVGGASKMKPTRWELERLGGHYLLTIVREDVDSGRAITGKLYLAPTDSAHRFVRTFPNQRIPREVLLWGYTDAGVNHLAPISVPPSSQNESAPGVQVDATGKMVIGNPQRRSGAAFDAGVYLYIERVDSLSFAGHWAGGGTWQPNPHGFFCARRHATPRRGAR